MRLLFWPRRLREIEIQQAAIDEQAAEYQAAVARLAAVAHADRLDNYPDWDGPTWGGPLGRPGS